MQSNPKRSSFWKRFLQPEPDYRLPVRGFFWGLISFSRVTLAGVPFAGGMLLTVSRPRYLNLTNANNNSLTSLTAYGVGNLNIWKPAP